MGQYFSGSFLTLLLFSIGLATGAAQAGTIGTPEAEIQRLEGEVAQAQNAFDAELLKLETNPNDPKVKAKAKILDEKTNELREEFRKRTTRSKTASGGSAPMAPSSTTTASNEPAPGPTLSGEGVKGEITYQKKNKTAPRAPITTESVDNKESPTPAASPAETGSGISEIQYPKKPNAKKKPAPSVGK